MNRNKRNLAKAIGITGAGALVWHKPVVNTLTLPAHASMSGDLYSRDELDPPDLSASLFRAPGREGGDSLLDLVFPQAYAGHDLPGSDRFIMCVWITGNLFTLTFHRIEARCDGGPGPMDETHMLYSASGELGQETGPLTIDSSRFQSDHDTPLPVVVTVSNLNPGVSVDLNIRNTGSCEGPCEYDFTLNRSDTCPTVDFTPGTFNCKTP